MSNFGLEKKAGLLIVRVGNGLRKEAVQELDKFLGGLRNDPAFGMSKTIVLDVTQLVTYDLGFLDTLSVFSTAMKTSGKTLAMTGASKELSKQIDSKGLTSGIQVHATFQELAAGGSAQVITTGAGLNIDVTFIKTFIDATGMTLKIQCFLEPKAGKPYLKGTAPDPQVDFAGMIGLTSKTFNGSISLCFPEKTFLHVMSKMFQQELTEVTPELGDGVGELMNIIFGQAKLVLNKKGYQIDKAIPTIVKAKDMKITNLASNPTVILPFTSEDNPFHLEITIEAPGTNGDSSAPATPA